MRAVISTSFFRSSLALAIGLSSGLRVAHADGPSLDAGIRAGIAGQSHYGSTHFVGNGVDLGFEAGVRVNTVLGIRIGLERGPRLVHLVRVFPADVERSAWALVGVAEYHLDRFFIGVGGGWVHESTTSEYVYSDSLGPVGISSYTTERSGPLVLARGGMQLGVAGRLSMNLVMQLIAQRVAESPPQASDHAYGASVGIEIRGLGQRTQSTTHDQKHSVFVGPDLGLTGTLSGSVGDFSAWDNLAPRLGLDAGAYVTSSTAVVIGAAGAPHMRAGHFTDSPPFDNNQAQLTLGVEAHRETLFASAGGGISRFTEKWSEPVGTYQYDRTNYSMLLYAGAGVELSRGLVCYRLGGELARFDATDKDFAGSTYAFTLTLGIRLSSAR